MNENRSLLFTWAGNNNRAIFLKAYHQEKYIYEVVIINNFELISNGVMTLVWVIFWLIDIQSYIQANILTSSVYRLLFAAFTLEFCGNLYGFEMRNHFGSALIFYVFYLKLTNKLHSNKIRPINK